MSPTPRTASSPLYSIVLLYLLIFILPTVQVYHLCQQCFRISFSDILKRWLGTPQAPARAARSPHKRKPAPCEHASGMAFHRHSLETSLYRFSLPASYLPSIKICTPHKLPFFKNQNPIPTMFRQHKKSGEPLPAKKGKFPGIPVL